MPDRRQPGASAALHRDAYVLGAFLAAAANLVLLGEAWWWKRRRDLARAGAADPRSAVLLVDAALRFEKYRLLGETLKWPTDQGRPPSPETQAVYLSAAWLRKEVEIPGLGSPSGEWSEEAVADLAAELAKAPNGLPWSTIADRSKLSHSLLEARSKVYGGRFEIVAPPADWQARISALVADAA